MTNMKGRVSRSLAAAKDGIQRISRQKAALPYAIAAVLLLVIAFEAATLLGGRPATGGSDFASMAKKIVAECKGASYKPTCYDEEIPRLMDRISMEEAFEVTRIVQDMDPAYRYCHVLGHKLSARETANDPSEWKSVITRCPSGLCSNGCIHGAFQERFRTEALTDAELAKYKPEFANVCESRSGFSPTGLEQASCYHALGHLFMYVTAADIDKSLDLCKELAVKDLRDYSQLCYDGAYMQIFQPLEPDDFALIEGKEVDKAEVGSFCDGFTGSAQGSCWSEAWPLFREELFEPKNVVRHCDHLSDWIERSRCFNVLTYVLTAQLGFDESRIYGFCSGMPSEHRANCFAQAASRMIETDYRNAPQSVALCVRGQEFDKGGLCFEELLKYSTYNFHVGSDAFTSYCSAMPEPWRNACLAQKGGSR